MHMLKHHNQTWTTNEITCFMDSYEPGGHFKKNDSCPTGRRPFCYGEIAWDDGLSPGGTVRRAYWNGLLGLRGLFSPIPPPPKTQGIIDPPTWGGHRGLWGWRVQLWTDSMFSPEDGLRCRQGVKPPLKLKLCLNTYIYIAFLSLALYGSGCSCILTYMPFWRSYFSRTW